MQTQNNISLRQRLLGTILVIDDDEGIRELAQVLLEELGSDVLMAENGIEGINLLKEYGQTIKAVILDVSMPGMNGKMCFKEIQKLNPELKVIFISGYAEADVMQGFEKGGALAFVKKPFRVDKFQEQVVTLLK